MKDGAMSLQENQHTDDEGSPSPGPRQTPESEQQFQEMQTEHPFQNMQTELQSKGAVLTKAWSDLFSFITRYQAELVVKENSVEIAEKEINLRKRQLDEMKPVVDAGNEEITKLQEEIQTSQSLLNRTQSELTVKERMLQSVRSDLNCNMEMLEKSRSELLGKQREVVHYRADLERLKSELTIKQEQILIKDNLLKKLQNQLMKENAELKEQLELKERTLEMERRAHELTKRSLRQSKSKSSNTTAQAVIEIPDSPPTLDLSVEQADFGLSNIISMAESQSKQSQPMEQDMGSSQFRLSHPNQDNALSRISAMSTDTFSDLSHRMSSQGSTSMSATPTKEQWSSVSPSITSPTQSLSYDNFNQVSSASDTFFPLSVSQGDDSKSGIDTSAGAMMMDSPRDSGMMPGTPSSGASDSNQGPPVPISGPIPSAGMSPGGVGGDGKVAVSSRTSSSQLPLEPCTKDYSVTKKDEGKALVGSGLKRSIGRKTYARHRSPDNPLMTHKGQNPLLCSYCGKAFHQQDLFKEHLCVHAGEKPCKFAQKSSLKTHIVAMPSCPSSSQSPPQSHTETEPTTEERVRSKILVDSGLKCPLCSKAYTHRRSLKNHLMTHTGVNPFVCSYCGKAFHRRDSLKLHLRVHTGERPYRCETCGRGFTQKCGLTTHMGKSPSCTSSSQRLAGSHAMRKPTTADKDEETTLLDSSLTCAICGKTYAHRRSLRNHLMIHKGEHPFLCSYCGKAFHRQDLLRLHIRSHTGEKPYKCEVCGCGFPQKSGLTNHMLVHLHQ